MEQEIENVRYEYVRTALSIQLGYNFNKQWKLFVEGVTGYYFTHDTFYVGGVVGIDLYW